MANIIDFFRKKRKKIEKVEKKDINDHKLKSGMTISPDGQEYPCRPIGMTPLNHNEHIKATKRYEDQLNEKQFGQMGK